MLGFYHKAPPDGAVAMAMSGLRRLFQPGPGEPQEGEFLWFSVTSRHRGLCLTILGWCLSPITPNSLTT